jgi:hypothetical protein
MHSALVLVRTAALAVRIGIDNSSDRPTARELDASQTHLPDKQSHNITFASQSENC